MTIIKNKKLVFSMMIALILATACGGLFPVASPTYPSSLDQSNQPLGLLQENTGRYAPILVPFTDFNTQKNQVQLFFDPYQHKGEFRINQNEVIPLPEAQLPVKTIEIPQDRLVIFTRELITSEINCFLLASDANWQQINLPQEYSSFLFRQAFAFHDQVYFILFDMQHALNRMFRLVEVEGQYVFDRHFSTDLPIVAVYKQQPHILSAIMDDRVILASGASLFSISESDGVVAIDAQNLDDKFSILELAADESSVYLLVKNSQYAITEEVSELFAIYDAVDQNFISFDFADAVPYHLRIEDGNPVVSFVETQQDLAELFELDIQRMTASGLMSAGINNYEGEVVWSQSYYLQGFIDLITSSLDEGYNHALEDLKTDLRTRLDFEIILLDQLLAKGPGLSCRAFTTDRTLAVHAVQSGKILLLLKRYRELNQPLDLSSFEDFKRQVINLEGHIEDLALSEGTAYPLEKGRYYLIWPKGVPFWADGAGIPYNHQNCWAAGVLYGEDLSDLDDTIVQAARDISRQVLDFEGFTGLVPRYARQLADEPDRYQWFYWWGIAKDGWSASDNISLNTPDWQGDGENIALPVYRTFDSIAILTHGTQFADLDPKLIDYFVDAVEEDGLDMFLIPYLAPYGKVPQISRNLAYKYIRFDDQPGFRDGVWAYRGLSRLIDQAGN